MMELIEKTENSNENIFEILSSEYSVDELEIRENPDGFALIQDPEGETVSVGDGKTGLEVEEVNAGDVEFEDQEEIDDVFGDDIMAE